MLEEEEQWCQRVIAKIVEMFSDRHDCTLAYEKAVVEALAAEGIYPPKPPTPF